MARSDYKLIPFGKTFSKNAPTEKKNFNIEGNPINTNRDDAYLLVQVRGVSSGSHEISINDEPLPAFDLPPAPGNSQSWQLWMDHIPTGLLKPNQNSIRITHVGNDSFEVRNVVVHWRE